MAAIIERICVYGIVQGVGFRPFVSRIADECQVTGTVANRGSYVEIFLKGAEERKALFKKYLREKAPERSAILKIDAHPAKEADISCRDFSKFEIIESEKEYGDIFVSPDIATCPKCRQELYDRKNRRYMHPFINCTACGPRVTILDAMPYDRERTSMGEFPMCDECRYEYEHSETRRYDAQPVCCNDCGPEVYLLGRAERGREAITAARRAIMDGKIVAIKGIGGFHLCCDAANEAAVRRLREKKRRPMKPFAVMMRDMDTIKRECICPEDPETILDGPQKPILLLPKSGTTKIAPSVAPDNPKIGVMLPYAPVQMLLFDYDDGLQMPTDCFVMTSGNVSGAPICRTDEDAEKEIAGFCDLILSHNRKIRLRADDSVMDLYKGEPYMIRRSRGYAPLPVMMNTGDKGQVLAVGGELKNTFCLAKDQLFYESPYVGDMADIRTVKALTESIDRMSELLEIEPSIVACDMHPKYNTTFVAQQKKLPVLQIQHHYAHALSCMAENEVDEPVIALVLDGTGYGTDGTIWGGELLLADREGFERLGHIEPFAQVGGDASAKEGYRIAASMLTGIYGTERALDTSEILGLCDRPTGSLIAKMREKRINTVTSTSAGRLFDAVSAVLGVRRASTFEGEASITLQFRAEAFLKESSQEEREALLAGWDKEKPENTTFATKELFRYLVEAYLAAEDKSYAARALAWLFHAAFGEQLAIGALRAAREKGIGKVALSGGVFQNTLLLSVCEKLLEENGLTVLRHHLIPANDGGIALGQAYAAMKKIQ